MKKNKTKKKKKKKKKAYLKPYYFGIYFEERENAQKRGRNFHFFLEKRRERDHAPLENSLTRTTFCARALFRAARLSSLSFIASCEHCSATTRFDSRGEKGKG